MAKFSLNKKALNVAVVGCLIPLSAMSAHDPTQVSIGNSGDQTVVISKTDPDHYKFFAIGVGYSSKPGTKAKLTVQVEKPLEVERLNVFRSGRGQDHDNYGELYVTSESDIKTKVVNASGQFGNLVDLRTTGNWVVERSDYSDPDIPNYAALQTVNSGQVHIEAKNIAIRMAPPMIRSKGKPRPYRADFLVATLRNIQGTEYNETYERFGIDKAQYAQSSNLLQAQETITIDGSNGVVGKAVYNSNDRLIMRAPSISILGAKSGVALLNAVSRDSHAPEDGVDFSNALTFEADRLSIVSEKSAIDVNTKGSYKSVLTVGSQDKPTAVTLNTTNTRDKTVVLHTALSEAHFHLQGELQLGSLENHSGTFEARSTGSTTFDTITNQQGSVTIEGQTLTLDGHIDSNQAKTQIEAVEPLVLKTLTSQGSSATQDAVTLKGQGITFETITGDQSSMTFDAKGAEVVGGDFKLANQSRAVATSMDDQAVSISLKHLDLSNQSQVSGMALKSVVSDDTQPAIRFDRVEQTMSTTPGATIQGDITSTGSTASLTFKENAQYMGHVAADADSKLTIKLLEGAMATGDFVAANHNAIGVPPGVLNLLMAPTSQLHLTGPSSTLSSLTLDNSVPGNLPEIFLSSDPQQGHQLHIGTLSGAAHWHMNVDMEDSKSDLITIDQLAGAAANQRLTLENAAQLYAAMPEDHPIPYVLIKDPQNHWLTDNSEEEFTVYRDVATGQGIVSQKGSTLDNGYTAIVLVKKKAVKAQEEPAPEGVILTPLTREPSLEGEVGAPESGAIESGEPGDTEPPRSTSYVPPAPGASNIKFGPPDKETGRPQPPAYIPPADEPDEAGRPKPPAYIPPKPDSSALTANLAYALTLGSMDSLNKRLAEGRYSLGTSGVFARLKLYKNTLDLPLKAWNSGLEFGVQKALNRRHSVALSMNYLHSQGDWKAKALPQTLKMERWSVALYDTLVGDSGQYLDVKGELGRTTLNLDRAGSLNALALRTWFGSVSGEVGLKHYFSEKVFAEPQAQLQYLRFSNVKVASNETQMQSLIGRLGVRAGYEIRQDPERASMIYARANLYHEFFNNASSSRYSTDTARFVGTRGSWGSLALGLAVSMSAKSYLYLDIEKSVGKRHQKGLEFNGGIRWAF